jgi:Flp pilus assembly protein TadG
MIPDPSIPWWDRSSGMMIRRNTSGSHRSARRRGFVLVTMALISAGVFGVVGLAVDIGRMFIAKNELQVYCDSAAVAAAQALDGTGTGLTRAGNAVAASTNKWNFGSTSVSAPSVTFATSAAGPWAASPNPATGYSYARVTATAPLPLYFLPLVIAQGTYTVTATAAAGQVPVTSLSRGIAPYTAVSTDTTGPDFGLVAGNSYTIHWPTFNANRHGCGQDTPDKCFNSSPCDGDSSVSQWAVVSNWGSQYHGYWGSNSASQIAAEVLNTVQLAPVAIGDNLDSLLTPGNKQSEAGYLDQRASQDTNTSDATPSAYLASASHNGRRLLPVAIVDPVDETHTTVIGFGQFLLQANGSPSNYYKKNTNGNSPYCATYVGPYNIGSSGSGTGGSTGAASVRLVQ